MSTPVRIRPMRPSDEPQAEALWKGMSPYRPGDEAEVEAMYETVRTSRDAGDKRWKALGTSAPDDPIQDASASWVAAVPSESGEERVRWHGAGHWPHSVGRDASRPAAEQRVAPEGPRCGAQATTVADDMRRRGVGTQLTQAAIDWCRVHGLRTLVLNTTTPQKPAIALYKRLGFHEAERTFLDKYELVRLRLDL